MVFLDVLYAGDAEVGRYNVALDPEFPFEIRRIRNEVEGVSYLSLGQLHREAGGLVRYGGP